MSTYRKHVIGRRREPNRRVIALGEITITTFEQRGPDYLLPAAVERTYERSYHVTKGYRSVLVRESVDG